MQKQLGIFLLALAISVPALGKPKKVPASVRKQQLQEARAVQETRKKNQQNVINDRIRDLAMQNKETEAYQRLIATLKPYIDAKDWETAAATAEQFRHFFGNTDAAYLDLLRTLTEPVDTTVTISAFPSTINSKLGSEYSPTISGDGKTIYFCGRYRTDNLGSEDIFMSKKRGGSWYPAKLVKELSTANGNEAPESVSQDGQTLLLFYNGKLYVSQKTAYGWMEPQPLPRIINNSYWQADAILSADGQALLFAAKKAVEGEERESMNIFVSTQDAMGNWSEPKSLGPTINTPFDERSPVLYSDMRTLYFCSSGHSTLGGLDVFKTTRKYEDSWTDWTEPVNLGKEINTTGDDCWYKITTDGTTAYFAKQTETNGLDLYWVTLPMAMRPDPVSTVSGVITDLSGKPLPAVIVWEDLETHREIGYSRSDPEDGSYFITLPEGKMYGYYVEKDGYWPASDYVDMRGDSLTPLDRVENIRLTSVRQMREEGLSVCIRNVFFDLDKDELLPESQNELQRVARVIKQNNLKVEISGHTDSRGSAEHNQDLSQRRAEAVKRFLVAEGCYADRMQAVGYGETRPIADNDTEEGMQQNRRVEVRIAK